MNADVTILYQTPLSLSNKAKENKVVINNDIYTSIFDYLQKEGKNKVAQPNLIIGEDGSGKTSLLKRLYLNIENSDKRLRAVFIEGKSLFSTDDIWKHCSLQDDSFLYNDEHLFSHFRVLVFIQIGIIKTWFEGSCCYYWVCILGTPSNVYTVRM